MSDQPVTQTDQRDGVIVVAVQPSEMDEDATRQMQAEVLAAAEQNRMLPVALDLSRVNYFPSLSLGAVVTLLSTLRKHQQRLILAGLQPQVREALAITHLDKLFEIHQSIDDAVAHQRRKHAATDE
jgi:anti-anti-sigma factor